MIGRLDRQVTDDRKTAVCKGCRELYWEDEGHPECLTPEYMTWLEKIVSDVAEYEESLGTSERQ